MKQVLLLAIMLLGSCGGGGGGGNDGSNSDSTTPTPTDDTKTSSASTLTINVVAALVTGASCRAYKITENAKGTLLASATSFNGQASFESFSYAGNAFFQCTGGQYLDEATGKTTKLKSLSAALALTTTIKEYSVTPLTDIAVKIGGSDLNAIINTHNAKVADQFGLDGLDITQIKPVVASNTNPNKYGLVLAALSQMGQNRGGTNNATSLLSVVEAVVADLTDGEISTNTINDFKTSVGEIKTNDRFNFDNVDVVADLGTADVSKPKIILASKTVSYVYGETVIKPTATITDNSTTTGIVITDNLGSNVGIYTLTYNATDSAGNKAIPQIATITITPKPITITADAVSKLQGTANNPALSDDRLTKLLSGDILTGTLGSIGLSTNIAGTYDITSTLSNSNYIITFVGENKFSINSKPQIILTSKTVSYVYGEAAIQPTATITSNSTTTGIVIAGNIGLNVGTYILTYTATDSLGNAAIPQIATIFITPKPIIITANAVSKVYGEATPDFGYVSVGLLASDTLSGTLTSNAVNAGTYNITSTLNHDNYAITFVGDNKFIISKKAITITANAATKVYGEATPSFGYVSVVLLGGDTLSGTLTSNAVNAGIYDIISTLNNINYAITFAGDNKFIISKKPITIIANPASKVYGDANPAFSYVSAGLVRGDTLSGTLTSNGVNIGTYNITSTLSHDNYDITFIGADKFSINPRPGGSNLQIIIASKTLSYVYGEAATAIIKSTATISTSTSTNTTGISITGSVGANVGTYTLTYTALIGNNIIREIAKIVISPKPVTIIANLATKVYGDANPVFSDDRTTKLLAGYASSLTGSLSASVAINANIGDYDITSTLRHINYVITFTGVNKLRIIPKPITITANDATRVYGTTTNPVLSDDRLTKLVLGDVLIGTLGSSGFSSVNADYYDITSTLSHSNYVITFDGKDKFRISPKSITVIANAVSRVYDATTNPTLSYVVTGLILGDTLKGALGSVGLGTRTIGDYDITSTLYHDNYVITFIGANKFSITKAIQSAFSVGNDASKTLVFGGTSGTTFTITTIGASSTSPATYSTSNVNIATIDASGIITIIVAGTVTIGATSTADNHYGDAYASFILTIYPSTTTLADAIANGFNIKLAWSAVAGLGVSYKVYYATKTIIGYVDLDTNYHNLPAVLIDDLTTEATTVLGLKQDIVYHFVATVGQNNVEGAISNEVSSTLQKPAAPTTGTINDTGVTFAGNYPTANNSTCNSSITAPQDCHQGRDAKAANGILGKFGGGRAGFDFTKLDSSGTILAIQNQKWSAAATSTEALGTKWSCVRDNYTGLIWEVKTNSGLHNVTNTFTWYNTATNTNGGSDGSANIIDACDGYISGDASTYCNTQAFVERVNNVGLCGAGDWQLPNKQQLKSILDYSAITGIDTDYFPNTSGYYFWSSTPDVRNSDNAWLVQPQSGYNYSGVRNDNLRVRLVRPSP